MIGKNNVFLGTEMKLNINIEPIAQMTMDDYEFTIDIFCSNSKVTRIDKSRAIRIDESNYVVIADTNSLGSGRVRCKVTAQIPDADFDDNLRTEVVIIDTGIDIVKNL